MGNRQFIRTTYDITKDWRGDITHAVGMIAAIATIVALVVGLGVTHFGDVPGQWDAVVTFLATALSASVVFNFAAVSAGGDLDDEVEQLRRIANTSSVIDDEVAIGRPLTRRRFHSKLLRLVTRGEALERGEGSSLVEIERWRDDVLATVRRFDPRMAVEFKRAAANLPTSPIGDDTTTAVTLMVAALEGIRGQIERSG